MIKYILFFLALVLLFFLFRKMNEGFQTAPHVDLYFSLKNATAGPTLIKSTDNRVNVVSTAVGTAKITIAPGLGTLKQFTGKGWSPAGKWVDLPASKIDAGGLQIKTDKGLPLYNTNYRGGATKNATMKNNFLPQAVTNITLVGLQAADFGTSTTSADSTGSMTNGMSKGANIWVRLMF